MRATGRDGVPREIKSAPSVHWQPTTPPEVQRALEDRAEAKRARKRWQRRGCPMVITEVDRATGTIVVEPYHG